MNGYFPLAQQGGSWRAWWRAMTGSGEALHEEHLQRFARRFSRRVHDWAKHDSYRVL